MDKKQAITHLVSRMASLLGDLYVVDLWKADLCAIGFALHSRPGYVVYASCFGKKRNRYYVEVENGKNERIVLDNISAKEVVQLLSQPCPEVTPTPRKKRVKTRLSASAPKSP